MQNILQPINLRVVFLRCLMQSLISESFEDDIEQPSICNILAGSMTTFARNLPIVSEYEEHWDGPQTSMGLLWGGMHCFPMQVFVCTERLMMPDAGIHPIYESKGPVISMPVLSAAHFPSMSTLNLIEAKLSANLAWSTSGAVGQLTQVTI
jgi:hypothetical protein